MQKLRDYIKSHPHHFLSIPALMCFMTFIINLWTSLKDGALDTNELHQLLSTADGFETVILLMVMVVLKDKTK